MAQGGLTMIVDQDDWRKLQNVLNGLSTLEQDAVIQKGLQEGLRIISQQGKANLRTRMSTDPWRVTMRKRMAAKRGGDLLSSVGTRVLKKKGKGYTGFGKTGRHAHLVDRGTVKRYTKSGGYRGSVKGSMFWTDAFNSQKDRAANELMDSIRLSINKLIARNR